MTDQTPQKARSRSFLGMAVFFLVIFWALWHGVIGPRVIAPTPGTQEAPPPPDPEREPPRE